MRMHYATCAISHLPILPGDPVKAIVVNGSGFIGSLPHGTTGSTDAAA